MNQIELRNYQNDLVVRTITAMNDGSNRIMLQLPTGGGKTIVFSAISQLFVNHDMKVLVLAHRIELILQAAKKLKEIVKCEVGIIKSGYPQSNAPIQVASVQSLVNRLDWFADFDLIIIDEAHHSTSKTYRKILTRYSNARHLGVTATPIRLDGTGFRDMFDELICGITIGDLINQNYLSKFSLYAHQTAMVTKGVRTIGGDFSSTEIAEKNEAVNLSGHLINSYQQYADGLRCLVFAINVNHSKIICDRYNQVGIPAMHLDGNTKSEDRKNALEMFAKGEIKVITNCNLFDEGLDIPCLEAVQIARPTKSLSKWLQMIGRSLRISDGKEKAVIIDHTENWMEHGLPTKPRTWTLDGVESKDRKRQTRKESGEIVETEIVEAEQRILTEVAEDVVGDWQQKYDHLLKELEFFGFKKGWLYFQLMNLKPPFDIWLQAEKYLGYRRGWAKYRFQEQQRVKAS